MNSSSQLQPGTARTSRRLLVCTIPVLTALFCVLVTATVFSGDVPGFTEGFSSTNNIDIHKNQASLSQSEYQP